MELKAAICPYCSGDLRVPEDRNTVKCMYCGKDILVRQAIQAATGPNIGNYLNLARTAFKSGNYQEAYEYYSKVLELDSKHYEAWLGKGETVGFLSDGDNFRGREMVAGIQNAVKFAPYEKKEEIRIAGAKILSSITMAYEKWDEPDSMFWGAGSHSLSEHSLMYEALELAHTLSPDDTEIIDNIIQLCINEIADINQAGSRPWDESWTTYILSVREHAQNTFDEYVEKRKKLDPSYQPPKIEKEKKLCFVVTATMGNYNHPYVILLQEFRDKWLTKRSIGRILIEKYYRYGPYFAYLIREREKLRRLSSIFIKFSVWFVTKILQMNQTDFKS